MTDTEIKRNRYNMAVVILNWNGRELLEKFLPSLLSTIEEVENSCVVVADNGSSDESLDFLRKKYPEISIIELGKNYGFAGGYNRALKEVNAKYYVALNSDVEVGEGWLSTIFNYMENYPQVAVCQPKIKSYRQKDYFEYAGASGGFIDKYGYPFCRGRVFDTVEQDKGQYDEIMDVFWASGAAMFLRAEVFWEVGGFDESFFAHMEEIDLCWRFKSRGYRVVCVPQSVVYHLGGATLGNHNPKKIYLNFRNNLLMLYKNMPSKRLKHIFDVRFYLDNLVVLQKVLQGRWKCAKAIIDARTYFREKKEAYSDIRDENILKSITAARQGVIQKNIVKEYYLKKNKTFDKIVDIAQWNADNKELYQEEETKRE